MNKALLILISITLSLVIAPYFLSNNQSITGTTQNLNPKIVYNSDIIVGSGEHRTLDGEIILRGNLEVSANGELTIINAQLYFDVSYDGQFHFKVYPNGKVQIINSVITSNDPRFKFYVIFSENSSVYIDGSTLSNMGFSEDYPGLEIYTDNVIIKNSVFSINYAAIKAVEVSNLYIENTTFIENYDGIRLERVSNVTIKDTVFEGGQVGLRASGSSNITLENVAFQNLIGTALTLSGSQNITMISDSFDNCTLGILLSDSSKVTIEKSRVYSNFDHGIYLLRVSNTTIQNNEIGLNKKSGIYVIDSKNLLIHNNSFERDIIWISGSGTEFDTINITEDNLINGYPILYVYNLSDLELSPVNHYGEIILVKSSNIMFNRTEVDAMIMYDVENITLYQLFSAGSIDVGIKISDARNIYISDFSISDADLGIEIESSQNIFISGCDIEKTTIKAISAFDVNTISISGCVFRYNEYGVFITQSQDVVISSNTFYRNYCGVGLGYAVSDALIYGNNFISNSRQAYDEGSAVWDNGKIGNYWSDYAGPDVNLDAIGDRPYQIDENSFDRYPSFVPLPKYTLDNIAPEIKNVQFDPETPQAGEKFSVKVDVEDNTKVATAILYICYMNETNYVRMEPSGDNSFRAEIGPFDLSSMINITIVVYDVAGNATRSGNLTVIIRDTQPPVITDVYWEPNSPNVSDRLKINARIIEKQTEIKSVYLYYSYDNGLTWIQVPMGTEDGEVYWAVIGPFDEPVVLMFYVQATDAAGNSVASQIINIVIGNVTSTIPETTQSPLIFYASIAFLVVSLFIVAYVFRTPIKTKLRELLKRMKMSKSSQ